MLGSSNTTCFIIEKQGRDISPQSVSVLELLQSSGTEITFRYAVYSSEGPQAERYDSGECSQANHKDSIESSRAERDDSGKDSQARQLQLQLNRR